MENTSFFHTKAGKLTLIFILIMIAFIIIMLSLSSGNKMLSYCGFIIMVVAIMYPPVDTYILKRNKK
ncbi:hypothetical protein EDC44_10533 [Cricetibacter osteomyelitidis]|uniref:Uncharacterized protein n=1 Tax=Cricetibacter osteomyelitidis TaxID=1521931 RepID=A0A4V2T262_9PAST|nr:hypothetical protein [Cricetibacter osteomyelitidis]TCP96213.1 hypothetical protein EDC44_10533 [Cricetibacter osteomyelitidis]